MIEEIPLRRIIRMQALRPLSDRKTRWVYVWMKNQPVAPITVMECGGLYYVVRGQRTVDASHYLRRKTISAIIIGGIYIGA